METTINKRINEIVDKFYGGKQTVFAKEIGYSPSRVNGWCIGTYEPKFETIARILERHPQINIYWFVLGNGEMLTPNEFNHQANCAEQDKLIEQYEEKIQQLNRIIEKLEEDKERLWNLIENNNKINR